MKETNFIVDDLSFIKTIDPIAPRNIFMKLLLINLPGKLIKS